jgi:WD40 repeat protein/predicted dehydrogenase
MSRWLQTSLLAVLAACGTSGFADEPLQKLAKKLAGTSGELASAHRTAPLGGTVYSVAFAPNGETLAIGLRDQVKLFDVATHALPATWTPKVGPVRSLAYSPDGELLAIGGYQKLQLWTTANGDLAKELLGHRGLVTGVAFSPDGTRLASSSEDETARVWSVDTGAAVTLLKHDYPVNGIAWSPDGQQLATAAGDELRPTKAGEVRLWSASGEPVRTWADHTRAALSVTFTPDGQRLLSGGLDEKIEVRDPAQETALAHFDGHARPVHALAVHPSQHAVLSLGGGRAVGGNRLIAWHLETLVELGVGEEHEAKPAALALSPDGKLAATGSLDQTVILWDLAFLNAKAETVAVTAADEPKDATPLIRVGVIGLDTSHAPAFAKLMNDPKDDATVAGCKVVAAYPQGSWDIKSSTERVPGYTEEFKKLGIEIVDSIPALLEKVDCVLLESNDGRPHLEQVLPVLKAGKPCFIDKPIAGTLTSAVTIFELSKHYKTPIFSSSSLRYVPGAQEARAGKLGDIVGCDAFSPAHLEATHPDLFWYGIHGVELLFTAMGTGCESVTRAHTEGLDVVVGTWNGGRLGTFRGIRQGAGGYGGRAFGTKATAELGTYAGYKPLVVEIVKFFKTKQIPVSEAETLEIYAFMEAADESKRRGGVPVKLSEVLDKARKESAERLPALLK